MSYLLDANALIEWLKGRPSVVELFDRLIEEGEALALTEISIVETYSGLRDSETGPADRIVAALAYWPATRAIAKLAGTYRQRYRRQGRPLSVPDVLLAAHAVTRDATLITANLRDFPMPELKLLPLPS
jgi:tRNA(fMet)-specific endonuclease VapC